MFNFWANPTPTSTSGRITTSTPTSTTPSQTLNATIAQHAAELKQRRRPRIILGSLITLFLASSGGISLAIVLLVNPVEVQAACLSRDLILFASIFAMLYICLHIRGARKDYTRVAPGPPQLYGQYLHATALIVSRLAIGVWISALVSTAVMISKAIPFKGFPGKLSFLYLLVCIGAIPSFIIIAATIEMNPKPFATASVSRPSFLTCRISDFAEDLAADMSISRRASLQRKHSDQSIPGSVLSVPTEEIFRLGAAKIEELLGAKQAKKLAETKTELAAHTVHPVPGAFPTEPIVVPPPPKVPDAMHRPKPVYSPGSWRTEWNNVAQEVGVPPIPLTSSTGSSSTASASTQTAPPSSSSIYSSQYTPSTSASIPYSKAYRPSQAFYSPPSSILSQPPSQPPIPPPHSRKPATASTSIASTAARSHLSIVRYASEPEVAVSQPMTVVPNPAHVAFYHNGQSVNVSGSVDQNGSDVGSVKRPDPVAVLRGAQEAQRRAAEELKEKDRMRKVPGNFVDG
ncbi:hypothetical protein GGR57DRAFT_342240 [Xylariaceae sp. FL1272]|nr:hypothetical protein GGR57DRAFT_342240 [Xylariaceae sp. FL1272]